MITVYGRSLALSECPKHFGFAARCEAMALPRRSESFLILGYAPGSGLALP